MLEYRRVNKQYGVNAAVRDVSLSVDPGEVCVLLGPSGCGKSTLLRLANRLVEPTSGTIWVAGRNVMSEDPVSLRRRIGYVIQSIGLLPHRTVAENIALTPMLVGMHHNRINSRVDAMLDLVRLDPSRYRDRYPAELSGGEAQRVGVARALAAEPPLVLMDEPFGAVDPVNRAAIRSDFAHLLRSLGTTILFVSHDVGEAIAIADRIALMRDGAIVAHDTPAGIVASGDPFVKTFLGNTDDLLLDILKVSDALLPHPDGHSPSTAPRISVGDTLRRPLVRLLRERHESLLVEDDHGVIVGIVTVASISDRIAIDRRLTP